MDTKVIKWNEGKTLSARRAVANRYFDKGDYASAISILYSENEFLSKDERAIAFSDIAHYYKSIGLINSAIRFWEYYLSEKEGEGIDPDVYDELIDCCKITGNKISESYYSMLRFNFPVISEESADKYVKRNSDSREERINYLKKEMGWFKGWNKNGIKLFENIGLQLGRDVPETVLDKDVEEDPIAYGLKTDFEKDDLFGNLFVFERVLAGFYMSGESYKGASIFYSKIPSAYRTVEDDDAFATANILRKEYDYAIKVCEESIRKAGYNVYACCNLCSIYNDKGDKEKADFYYNKAISNDYSAREAVKIISCAFMMNDYDTAYKAFDKVIKECPYESERKCVFALVALTVGETEVAYNALCEAYKISPDDEIIKWYMEETNKLLSNEKNDISFPLPNEKTLPAKVLRAYDKTFSKIIKGEPVKISKEKLVEQARLAAFSGSDKYSKNVADAIYAYCDKELAHKALNGLLVSEFCGDNVKFRIIELYAEENEEKTVGLIYHESYMQIHFPSFSFGKEDDVAKRLIRAYGDIIKKMIVRSIAFYGKVEKTINKLYKKHYSLIQKTTLSDLELEAAIAYLSKFKEFEYDDKALYSIFETEEAAVSDFVEKIKGSKNAKTD